MLTLLNNGTSLGGRVHTRPGDEFLMCDVPLEPNRATLLQLLHGGARVHYFNHHVTEEIPWHPQLQATVDSSNEACTSLIVDRLLGGKYRDWAVVGAYGDHLTAVADRLASGLGFVEDVRARLRELGELISYNACAAREKDAYMAPARLYDCLCRYPGPLDFLQSEPLVSELNAVRREDLSKASALAPYWQDASACVYVLPDAPWAHRVASDLYYQVVAAEPKRAHAFLRPLEDGYFQAKVHAARGAWTDISVLGCAEYSNARPRAWIIEHLPNGEIDHLIRAFSACQWGRLRSPFFH